MKCNEAAQHAALKPRDDLTKQFGILQTSFRPELDRAVNCRGAARSTSENDRHSSFHIDNSDTSRTFKVSEIQETDMCTILDSKQFTLFQLMATSLSSPSIMHFQYVLAVIAIASGSIPKGMHFLSSMNNEDW